MVLSCYCKLWRGCILVYYVLLPVPVFLSPGCLVENSLVYDFIFGSHRGFSIVPCSLDRPDPGDFLREYAIGQHFCME